VVAGVVLRAPLTLLAVLTPVPVVAAIHGRSVSSATRA